MARVRDEVSVAQYLRFTIGVLERPQVTVPFTTMLNVSLRTLYLGNLFSKGQEEIFTHVPIHSLSHLSKKTNAIPVRHKTNLASSDRGVHDRHPFLVRVSLISPVGIPDSLASRLRVARRTLCECAIHFY